MPSLRLLLTGFTFAVQLAAAETEDCCPPKPEIKATGHANGEFKIDLNGEPGVNYAIEQSNDLTFWTRGETRRSDSGELVFTYPIPSGAGPRFFRALDAPSSDGLGGSFLFDGTTFTGWQGNTTSVFRTENCAIVGGSLSQNQATTQFLCTTGQFTNFILRLQFKAQGTSYNSGINFRSQRLSNQSVIGYQADLGNNIWGSLYEEGGRGGLGEKITAAAANALIKPNDWNNCVIKVDGAVIQIWINDFRTVNYTEEVAPLLRTGIIALQVHSTNGSNTVQASFRRITLEVLP